MTTLREAATHALEALEGGADSWQLVGPAIDALKEALVEDAMQKFTDVNQELEAALAEPVQEPVANEIHGCHGGQGSTLPEQPAQEPVATFDEVWDAIDWDKWRMQPIRELVRMIHSKTNSNSALAEPKGGGNLPPPLQEPKDFDHAIGADRFKVVRGAFWWHVLIGDSPTKHGKFHSRASAEKMAADLLREFRNGAFVQHEAALAEPVQEQVWVCPDSAEHRYQKPGHCEDCGKNLVQVAEPMQEGCDHCNQPLYAAVKCRVCGRVTEPVKEPVAWRYELATTLHENEYGGWAQLITPYKPNVPEGSIRNLTPLYTAPPKPLTEEEIYSLFRTVASPVMFARAIERAHGIT